MPRGWFINGDSMIRVKGGLHMSGGRIGVLSELGLAKDQIKITPRIGYEEVNPTGWGVSPADLNTQGGEILISCTLIDIDYDVLKVCENESRAVEVDGTLAPTGEFLGGLKSVHSSGNHFFTLNISSPVEQRPIRFLSVAMHETPYVLPLGNDASEVEVTFRAIPYMFSNPLGVNFSPVNPQFDFTINENARLWDNEEDT